MTTLSDIAFQSAYAFGASLLLAFVEIQIEGPDGWAKNLPTWRDRPDWAAPDNLWFRFASGTFRRMSGGNRLTGYHMSLLSFLLVVMLFPVMFAQDRGATALLCLGHFFIMTVTWDFLWFVFNPHYGLKRFKPKFIGWHPRRLGPMPLPYPGGHSWATMIALGAGTISESWRVGLVALAVQWALTGACVLLVEWRRSRTNA